MTIIQHIWLVIYWIIFGVLHSVLAGDKIKKNAGAVIGGNFKFYRLSYSLIAVFTLGYILYYHFSMESFLLWQVTLAEQIISVAISVAGILLMSLTIRKYFFRLSGIDVFMREKAPAVLQTGGLNAYMRHPLYTGTLLFVFGCFLLQPLLSNLISAACIFIYTAIGTYLEERRLLKLFGDAYKDYSEKVPMFIPKFG